MSDGKNLDREEHHELRRDVQKIVRKHVHTYGTMRLREAGEIVRNEGQKAIDAANDADQAAS